VRGGGDEPSALALWLQVSGPVAPGHVAEAMPPRFALAEDGTAYVGGTSAIEAVRLEGAEVRDIEKAIDRIRKIPNLQPKVVLGQGQTTYHLIVRRGRPLDLTATGDPGAAPPALRPVAALLSRLADFSPPDLRPFRPVSYALAVKEESLPGGCRSWTFPVPLVQAMQSPQLVPAAAAEAWPTGGNSAQVCSGDKRYLVSLRPMLPGEHR